LEEFLGRGGGEENEGFLACFSFLASFVLKGCLRPGELRSGAGAFCKTLFVKLAKKDFC
jgi:hypothetical protein